MNDPIVERIKQLIRNKMPHFLGSVEVEDDTLLFEGGLNIDSVAAVELIAATEEHFEIEYEENDLSEEHFKTPKILAELVKKRRASSSS